MHENCKFSIEIVKINGIGNSKISLKNKKVGKISLSNLKW